MYGLKEKTTILTLRVPEALKTKLGNLSAQSGYGVSEIVRRMINTGLKKEK